MGHQSVSASVSSLVGDAGLSNIDVRDGGDVNPWLAPVLVPLVADIRRPSKNSFQVY